MSTLLDDGLLNLAQKFLTVASGFIELKLHGKSKKLHQRTLTLFNLKLLNVIFQ